MKTIVTHYGPRENCSWIHDFSDGDYLIYNRTADKLENSLPRANYGDCDYDKLSYLVDYYDELPELFLLTKSNIFKFITPEEFWPLKEAKDYTPVLTQNHRVYSDERGQVCFYDNGLYYERNDSWYTNSVPGRHFKTYGEFAEHFSLLSPEYIGFAPGGSYILTKERVYRHSRDFYNELRNLLPYSVRPGEAQMIERSYHTLWS